MVTLLELDTGLLEGALKPRGGAWGVVGEGGGVVETGEALEPTG